MIRASKTPKEAKDRLMASFELTEIQAQAILDMRLHRLTSLEQEKIKENVERFQKLSAEEKQKVRERFSRWRKLPLSQKRVIRQRYRKFQEMSGPWKQQLMQQYQRWQDLSPAKRNAVSNHRNGEGPQGGKGQGSRNGR